jgi:hypothetical protein
VFYSHVPAVKIVLCACCVIYMLQITRRVRLVLKITGDGFQLERTFNSDKANTSACLHVSHPKSDKASQSPADYFLHSNWHGTETIPTISRNIKTLQAQIDALKESGIFIFFKGEYYHVETSFVLAADMSFMNKVLGVCGGNDSGGHSYCCTDRMHDKNRLLVEVKLTEMLFGGRYRQVQVNGQDCVFIEDVAASLHMHPHVLYQLNTVSTDQYNYLKQHFISPTKGAGAADGASAASQGASAQSAHRCTCAQPQV